MRSRVSARVARFEDGHFGDHKTLGAGIYEARIFVGPGYRVYFANHDGCVILLLRGGDKATQNKDVQQAKEFFKNYSEVRNTNKKS
ncbi:MAG: addiction module antitoxin RelB [Bdellovibrio sp.]|nr:MAG: addiction module antitoxin RelB [Bdellovibrio sp.]